MKRKEGAVKRTHDRDSLSLRLRSSLRSGRLLQCFHCFMTSKRPLLLWSVMCGMLVPRTNIVRMSSLLEANKNDPWHLSTLQRKLLGKRLRESQADIMRWQITQLLIEKRSLESG